jgi:hypothetical protein
MIVFFLIQAILSVKWTASLSGNVHLFFLVSYFILLPASDVFTDINYILTSPFTTPSLLIAACVFLVIPSFDLLYIMLAKEVPFDEWFLAHILLSRGDLGILRKLFLIPAYVIDVFYKVILLLIGLFLHSTKFLTLRSCHNWWYRLWTGGRGFDIDEAINVSAYNEGVIVNVLLESVP